MVLMYSLENAQVNEIWMCNSLSILPAWKDQKQDQGLLGKEAA